MMLTAYFVQWLLHASTTSTDSCAALTPQDVLIACGDLKGARRFMCDSEHSEAFTYSSCQARLRLAAPPQRLHRLPSFRARAAAVCLIPG